MKTGIISLALFSLIFLLGCNLSKKKTSQSETYTTTQVQKLTHEGDFYRLHYQPIDKAQGEKIIQWLDQGKSNVKDFFKTDFKKEFDVYIFPERDSLDAQWQKDWNMPEFKSQCWMVASGIAHRLDILSPRVWPTQGCEHDSNDEEATRKLILHELIHVFHGQYNPSPTFEHIDNIDWLVEGLAVYASGQLDAERYDRAKNSIQKGEGPVTLANIWKGEHRYGYSGSLVKYIDDTYGRDVLIQLMGLTTADEVLKLLHTTEEELLEQWRQSFNKN